jgi:hypothetical protein
MADLDDLIDDIDISKLQSKPTTAVKRSAATATSTATASTSNNGKRIVSTEIKPWLAASANVPKEFREKWTRMAKQDSNVEIVSSLQPSHAFRGWDAANVPRNGVNKCLQELVKVAANAANVEESKTQRLLSLVNPVTDSENGKQFQRAFATQVLKDLRFEITADPNYDPAKFPHLAQALKSIASS